MRDPHGLAVLAAITCVIPGTVWSELALDRSALLIHIFDLDDEQAAQAEVALIKHPLRAAPDGDLRMSDLLFAATVFTHGVLRPRRGAGARAHDPRPVCAGSRAGDGPDLDRGHADCCWCWRSATAARCLLRGGAC
jgi:hypothetical protein